MGHLKSEIEFMLLGILGCVVVYSLLTKAIGRTILTLPIIFVAIGLFVSEPVKMLGSHEALRD